MLSRFLGSRGEDPFAMIQRELGRVVEDVFRGAPMASRGGTPLAPSLDVRETPQGLEITAELPGVAERDITLSLDGEVLTLRGEKREEKTSEERGVHIQERSYGSFQRSLRLPYAADPSRVSAEFDKGVLRVILPRPEALRSKDNRIPIRGAGQAAVAGGTPNGGTGAPSASGATASPGTAPG